MFRIMSQFYMLKSEIQKYSTLKSSTESPPSHLFSSLFMSKIFIS